MAFAKNTTRAAARFVVSAVAFLSSMPILGRKVDETSDMRSDASPTFTDYSSECDEVALSEDSFVLELRERDIRGNQRISVAEALVYEPRPASIRSVSSASVESIEELDITRVPLSVDELEAVRLHRAAEDLAEEFRAERRRKRRFFRKMATCFGQECFVQVSSLG